LPQVNVNKIFKEIEMENFKRAVLKSVGITILLSSTNFAYAEESSVAEKLVESFVVLADGPHKGYRANHAKGIMAEGIFSPSPSAATITSANHLQSTESKVLVRFSNATGVPNIPDSDPHSFPKGIALRFQMPDETTTDIVSISINGFLAKTPEEFLDLLTAVRETKPDSPKPNPVEKFFSTHPAAKEFVTTVRPTPASFATINYYGVNAFKFTNKAGKSVFGRYLIKPVNGEKFITVDEVKGLDNDYLVNELPKRLTTPVKYLISVQLAKKGDNITDATVVWSKNNPIVDIGTLTINSLLSDSKNDEKSIMFNPLSLVEGISPSDDPILLARPTTYAISYGKRLAN
jgi:catalase